MEAILSPSRIEFTDPTRTVSFAGTDMLRAEIGNDPSPPYNTVSPAYYVTIYLTGDAEATYGTTYKVDLRPGVITNQPTWENKSAGAQACLLDIAPIIRASATGSTPLVKNSIEYDGGAIQLDNDQASPGPDMHYATDGAGVRGWYPSGGTDGITELTADVTATGPGIVPATISNNAVSNNKLADMPEARIKMRLTGTGTGDPIDATADQLGTTMDATMADPYVRTSAITGALTGINGDVVAGPGTGVQPSTIQNNVVTNAKAADMAQATIKGRAAGSGTGDPQDLTATQAINILITAPNPVVRASDLGTYVTSVSASGPLASSGGTTPNITHLTSGVGAGTYIDVQTISVNATGHITGIATGSATPTYSGALLPYALKTGQGSYDLQAVYGLNYVNGSMKLSQLYSLSVAQTKFARLFQWMTSPGFGEDNAFVMDLRHVVACWWEALLQGNSNTPLGTARIGSNNEILMPRGNYIVNHPMVYDSGSYIGRGTEPAFDGADNTMLVFDRAGWKGPGPDRAILMASTYGNDTAFGYVQGVRIDGFRLAGGMNWSGYSGTDQDIGLLTWDLGEQASVGYIYAEGFHGLGVKCIRGTPTIFESMSLFENGLAGFGLYGNDLSTINIGTISGDDNPALIRRRSGYGRPAGGSLNVGLTKSESGKRTPSRGQIIMDSAETTDTTGAYARDTFSNVWYACDFSQTDALWVYRSFTGANARLSVGSFSGYGFSTILQDVTNGKRWASPGSFDTMGFVWNPTNGGSMWSPPPDNITWTSSSMLGTERLGVFYPSGTFDYVALTPVYDYTQGSPSPPASTLAEVYAGAVSNVRGCGQFSVGESGQCYGLAANQYLQPISGTPAWSIQPGGTGNATVNASTGVITATAIGTVNVRCFIPGTPSADFVDFVIEVVP